MVGAEAIGKGAFFCFFCDADAAEPIGGCAPGVGVVIDKGMLGGEAAFVFVKLCGAMGGDEKGFKE